MSFTYYRRRRTGVLRSRAALHGFTAIEILIATALLTLMFSSMALVSKTSQRAFVHNTAAGAVELRAGAALRTITTELEQAASSHLYPDPVAGVGASEVFYREATGFNGNDVIYSDERSLRYELDPGETNDGTDEDGDGLIDEGQIVLVVRVGLATESQRVITRGVAEFAEGELPNGVDDNGDGLVDEPGFVLERRNGAIDVRLTLAQAVTGWNEVVVRTARTSVIVRN